jgi:hypothetical protein
VLGDPVNLVDPSGLYIDTPVDAGFVVYDIITLGLGCGSWDALGLDAAGIFLPGIAGLGHTGELLRAAKMERRVWPKTGEEMDDFLGFPGARKPDGPMTPGRNKVEWRPNSHTRITYEQHPYHPDAPEWHRGPHWHLDTPGNPHQRYLPGDPIPGYGE